MSEKASSTYVTFDLVDYDVTKDVGEEKPVGKWNFTKIYCKIASMECTVL